MTIGEKIKELRRKNDLTQERLADYLHVSYQAVSKWECGVTTPDFSMIVPLTKILHVSADELLGLTENAVDERKAYFDAEYEEYWNKDDHDADYAVALQAVTEYPGDFRYLEWLASVEYYTAFDDAYRFGKPFSEHFIARMESSIKHYQMILDDCTDEDLRRNAIWGIVLANKYLNRDEEARRYAETYPENNGQTRDDALAACLRGDELKKLRQKIMATEFKKFLNTVGEYWGWSWEYETQFSTEEIKAFLDAEEAMIRAFLPDGNYQGFIGNMSQILWQRAQIAAEEGKYGEAVRLLAEDKEYAVRQNQLFAEGKLRYTGLFLKDYEKEYKILRPYDAVEDWREHLLRSKYFDPLREREDFKALLKE